MSPSGSNSIHPQAGGNTFAPAWHIGIFAWEAQEKSTEDQKKKRLCFTLSMACGLEGNTTLLFKKYLLF